MNSSGLSDAEVRELYVRYGHLVLRRSRLVLRDPQLAEDALQTVFLKALKHGASIRTASSQLAWLYRSVDHCCFDIMRARRRNLSSAEHNASWYAPAQVSEAPIAERSLVERLWARLGARERYLAVLVYRDGLTQGEASRFLGWSRQTVNKKINAIREVAQELATDTGYSK